MIRTILRIAERHPAAFAITCPQWLSDAIAAHYRRQRLVADIARIAGRDVAFVALWLARAWYIRGGTVEGALSIFRANLLRYGR